MLKKVLGLRESSGTEGNNPQPVLLALLGQIIPEVNVLLAGLTARRKQEQEGVGIICRLG